MTEMTAEAHAKIIAKTEYWLEKAVIGLNLCPFAKSVHTKKQLRYKVSNAISEDMLLEDLSCELQTLQDTDTANVETVLLIHPYVLNDFFDYNNFLDTADAAVSELELEGEIQIASFHPDYQFAGNAFDDIENFTNRSPYPMLHLLRESTVAKAANSFPDVANIYRRNIETLHRIGRSGWEKLRV